MKISILKTIVFCCAAIVAASCASTKKVAYFQDGQDGTVFEQVKASGVVARPADKITIIVNSKDPQLAAIFNLPVVGHMAGNANGAFGTGQNLIASYTVDSEGSIDFPVLGKINVNGLSREQIAAVLKDRLVSTNYINDAVVTVEFNTMYVSVLGDVQHPGRVNLDKDRFTVIDAVTKAGDLNITANRTVKVFREENGRQVCYTLDLTNAESMFQSPAYYLRQEDIVYVDPNSMKIRQSTVNGNNLVSTSFWVSVGSLLTSVATLVINALYLNNRR